MEMQPGQAKIQSIVTTGGADNAYQVLFDNVVTAYGVVLVGLTISGRDIKDGDIRVGDTVAISKNTDGLYIKKATAHEEGSVPFFPPEPEAKPSYLMITVGPFDAKKSQVDLKKAVPMAVRGVMTNAGIPHLGVINTLVSDGEDAEDLVERVSTWCTASG